MLVRHCVVVQKTVSVFSSNKDDDDIDDAKSPLPNRIVVSMLALPLLQIVSLPQTDTELSDSENTLRDCQVTSRHLLSVVHQYATQHRPRHRHGDAGALLVLPSAASHTCLAYVQLARYLSETGSNDLNDDSCVNGVINDWLQQVNCLLSADIQPSVLLTQLIAAIFLIRDDMSTVDSCLQLLHAICQSNKTQVCYLYRYVTYSVSKKNPP